MRHLSKFYVTEDLQTGTVHVKERVTVSMHK